ncbi:transposase IS4 family protein [Heyndrickxia coagulans 2-6]|nr:ATP-binding cassette domain-containing protein [Heyndrickxia coagulans]AEH54749.1 transposase IS4 family protein [Heyndrickxia coagulans 2-6]
MNLTIEEGKVVGILGPNGSGKTTLIKILTGLLRQTGGEVRIGGYKVGVATKSIVSYLPDRNFLYKWMRIKDALKLYQDFTDIKITKKNVERLIAAGRSRWKIENQGFNEQKNNRYNIEHANSQNYTAMKNHYLLVQITDIIRQLFEKGSSILKALKKTAKEKSSNLLESFRTRILTDEDFTHLSKPIQVRFT